MNTNQPPVQDRASGETGAFSSSGLWWGALLIAGGALWLIDAVEVTRVSPLVTAVLFAVAGIGFAIDFVRHPASWWAAIPAGALVGLGALIAFVTGTSAADEWGASMLIAGAGLGFGAVALRHRTRSWALIPASVLIGVAIIVASVPIVNRGEDIAVVVLVILAIAMVAVALVPIRGRRMLWTLVPAGILVGVAWFLAGNAVEELERFNWATPVVVVAIGLFVVIRSLSRRGGHQGV